MISLRNLPLEDRLRLFNESINLYNIGIRPHKIAQLLDLCPRTVCLWVRGERKPGNEYLPKTKLDKTKRKEIAYIAGVVHSDGTMGIYKKRCIIMLRATDEDFIEAFRNALEAVTGKKPKVLHQKKMRSHVYNGKLFRNTKPCLSVAIASKELYEILNNPEEYINFNPQDYIRAFADGDGSLFLRKKQNYVYCCIHLYNKDKSKLEKIHSLLTKLDIHSYIKRHVTDSKNIYALCIYRKNSIKKFMEKIGFSIQRKMQKWIELKEAGAGHSLGAVKKCQNHAENQKKST